jgi:hypothetical protein
MPIVVGLVLLAAIYALYKLFIDGWLFKIILFVAGWFGLYVAIYAFTESGSNTPMTVGHNSISWAFIIPTVICFLALLCTKVEN